MPDTTATDHLLTTTRSVRRRLDLDRPVDPAVITDCLRIAIQAPTAANTQQWRWVVVTDPERRRGLAEIYRQASASYFSRAVERVMDEQTRRVFASAMYLAEILDRVPVHVVPCIEGRFDGAGNALAAGAYGSILPAVWSLMLALKSRGLGSAWTTLHLRNEPAAAELLGIPDTVTQVALLPVAYTTGGDFRPADRRPVEDITFWEQWGGTADQA